MGSVLPSPPAFSKEAEHLDFYVELAAKFAIPFQVTQDINAVTHLLATLGLDCEVKKFFYLSDLHPLGTLTKRGKIKYWVPKLWVFVSLFLLRGDWYFQNLAPKGLCDQSGEI